MMWVPMSRGLLVEDWRIMLRTLALLGVTALACGSGGGSSIGNVQPPATAASTDAADVLASQIRSIDDDCRDVTSRASSADASSLELDGLELRSLGTLDGHIRVATGLVEVGENTIGVTMCYRSDGSLA